MSIHVRARLAHAAFAGAHGQCARLLEKLQAPRLRARGVGRVACPMCSSHDCPGRDDDARLCLNHTVRTLRPHHIAHVVGACVAKIFVTLPSSTRHACRRPGERAKMSLSLPDRKHPWRFHAPRVRDRVVTGSHSMHRPTRDAHGLCQERITWHLACTVRHRMRGGRLCGPFVDEVNARRV